jgi:hypothetical protein
MGSVGRMPKPGRLRRLGHTEGKAFYLIVQRHLVNCPTVRKLKTSMVVSAVMLAAAHAFATLEVAPTRNLQAAEAQAQETVKLSISGMV